GGGSPLAGPLRPRQQGLRGPGRAGLGDLLPGRDGTRGPLIAALAAVLGAAATYLVLRSSIGLTWWSHRRRSRSWLRAGVVAAAFLPLIAWNAITLPMPYAQVCPTPAPPSRPADS